VPCGAAPETGATMPSLGSVGFGQQLNYHVTRFGTRKRRDTLDLRFAARLASADPEIHTNMLEVATSTRWQEERQFGRTVGIALLLLSAWFVYRGRYPGAVPYVAGIGILLVGFALVWPRALTQPFRAWMTLAEGMAFVSSRVILTIVFLVVVTPLGLIMRRTRWDPLERRGQRKGTYWAPYSARQRDPRHFERMF